VSRAQGKKVESPAVAGSRPASPSESRGSAPRRLIRQQQAAEERRRSQTVKEEGFASGAFPPATHRLTAAGRLSTSKSAGHRTICAELYAREVSTGRRRS